MSEELSSDGAVEATMAILAMGRFRSAPYGVIRGYEIPIPDVATYESIYHKGNPNRGHLVVTHIGTTPQLGRGVEWKSQRRNDHQLRVDGAWDLEPDADAATTFRLLTDHITTLLNARETVQMSLGVAGAGLQMGAWNFTPAGRTAEGGDHLAKGFWIGTLGNADVVNIAPS